MTKYSFYSNVNGKETRRSGTLPNSVNTTDIFDECLDYFFNPAKSLLPATQLIDRIPTDVRRSNKNHCPVTFPPSNAWIDSTTKELKIVIAANGVSEDEYCVELDDDKIIVTFDKKEDNECPVYDWKGLKFVTNEVLPFSFDQRYHDASTAEVKLDKGCLYITIQPREEVRPIRKVLAGKLKKDEADKISKKENNSAIEDYEKGLKETTA